MDYRLTSLFKSWEENDSGLVNAQTITENMENPF